MKGLDKTTKIIAALGAIDLGLMTFNYELISSLLGASGIFSKILFAIIGLSGIWALVKIFK